MEAFTVNGIPAPIYVAKRMAYSQENDNFGILVYHNDCNVTNIVLILIS